MKGRPRNPDVDTEPGKHGTHIDTRVNQKISREFGEAVKAFGMTRSRFIRECVKALIKHMKK